MTVENMFVNLTASHPPPPHHPMSHTIQIPPRTRQTSLGSSGSFDSGSSGSVSPPSPLSLDDVWLLQRLQSLSVSGADLDHSGSESSKTNINPTRYKTELCRSFEESGYCKYSEKCQFAHGMDELRKLMRHPKYKTELCRTYHTAGFCPYGLRCHFIHSEDVAKLAQIGCQKDPHFLLAQQVARQHILAQLKNEMIQQMPAQFVLQTGVGRPKVFDLHRLAAMTSQPMDSSRASITDSSPSLSPVLSILSPEDLFGNITSGIPTPPPGFTIPPPPLYPRRTSTPAPVTVTPAALEESLRQLSEPEVPIRCMNHPDVLVHPRTHHKVPMRSVTPPTQGVRPDQSTDWAKSPSRLPFFTGLGN